ncbi:hypothetical protein GCM10011579_084470 [Streptomyces albiflavescens]|uniref:Uncharacterized protein n=1 Tax=Streptomyces albiflavescens TaxID=1623582 RepID=A0A917YEZ4_9ACTN|nr:hypothetical protein GCM10011579_084470 [Streptomyces albiflavescens]
MVDRDGYRRTQHGKQPGPDSRHRHHTRHPAAMARTGHTHPTPHNPPIMRPEPCPCHYRSRCRGEGIQTSDSPDPVNVGIEVPGDCGSLRSHCHQRYPNLPQVQGTFDGGRAAIPRQGNMRMFDYILH